MAVAATWLACLLLTAAPAMAVAVTDQRPLLFGFDGSDTTAGRFAGVRQVAIDEATGDLYVLSVAGAGRGTGSEQEPSKRVIDKFNYKGEAQSFAWTGTSSLTGAETPGGAFGVEGFFEGGSPFTDIGIDDSCAVHEPPLSGSACESFDPANGTLYVQEEAGPLHVFNAEGRYQCTLTRTTVEPGGFSIDASGNLWLIDRNIPRAREFANTGCSPGPPAQIGEFTLPAGNGSPLRPAVDASGNDLYVADCPGCPSPIVEKYVAGNPDSLLTTMPTRDLTVNHSGPAGHVFAIGETKFQEFEPCASPGCGGNEVAGSPFGDDLIGEGRGVAFSPARDWVYVSDLSSGTVKVFGPPASGTAPDVKTDEADEIGKTEATLDGTINPQSVPNSYHFEWVRGEAQHLTVEATGGTFRLSTRGSLPAFTEQMPFDVSPAALEAELEGLYGGGNLVVTGESAAGGEPGEYTVVFENGLAGHDVQQMESDSSSLTGGAHKAAVRTVTDGQPWGAAQPQPTLPESNPSIEPSDSVDHPVSQSLTNLRPNTTYDARLVGTNTEPEGDPEKRLNAYASPDTFTTLPPPAPTVSGLAVSEIAPESAKVAVTVDPQGDETVWQILTSTEAKPGASQLECEALSQAAFEIAQEGTIPLGESGTVDLEEELTELERSQTYCLRVVATNGGGSAGEDAVFTTGAVAPTEVRLAFAAPRTDNSATLNFYVNPQGEAPLAFRFEYSADGTSWTPLEEVVSTVEVRRQIVVAEGVGGLTPNTAYQYRLSFVKNEAGEFPKGSLPSPKSFTTRTSAEMTLPPNALGEAERRGIELVNNPDKGNQHVQVSGFISGSDAPVTADGNKMVWTLAGGAPGGTSGVYNAFLAEREEGTGWRSRPIVPPAEEQVGGGSLKYRAEFASPDFTRFVFRTEGGLFPGEDPKSTYVRLDNRQHQEVLAHFDVNAFSTPVDVTDDTAHVLHAAEDTNLLEDIGSGTPEVVGLMPGGSPPPCGIHSGSEFAGRTGGSMYAYPGYHWISSTDASRIYFETRGSDCSGPEGLYVRNRETGTTTKIANSASFIRAITDGSGGFFTTNEALASSDKNSDLDVYEWTEGGGASCLTCVVKDANISSQHAAVRVSDDFSHVYFLSTSQLVAGLGAQGDLNVYVVSGGKLRFVADPNEASVLSSPGQMEMSSDGNVLTFLSSTRLTADRIGSSCVNTTDKAPHSCRELYRYDDRDGSIECVSCRHGATTSGDVFTENNNGGVAFRISGDGSTIAFATPQPLLPADVNGSYDVYEWRNGAVRLITDGETKFATGLASPDLAGIDANGANVFFVVTDPGLTGFEHDGVDNLYDARIGGGFPRPTEATHCNEESCQGPLQGAPAAPAPTSDSFQGAGNLPPSRHCRRHRVRRHGHCVRKHRHKRKAK